MLARILPKKLIAFLESCADKEKGTEEQSEENPGVAFNQNGKLIQHDENGLNLLSKNLGQLTTDITEFSKMQEAKIDMLCEKLNKFELMMMKMHEDNKRGNSTERRGTDAIDGTPSKTEQLCEQIGQISEELGKIDFDRQQIRILNNKANKFEIMLNEVWQEINASRDGLLVWKIENVGQALTANQEEGPKEEGPKEEGPKEEGPKEEGPKEAGTSTPIMSDFIYTGKYGYKLQAIAYLNGMGSGQGTHLSVYLMIHPGKYDGALTWPFKQRIYFSLLDQSEDEETRKHETKGLECNRKSASFLRPTSSANPGWGFPKFIELEKLQNGPYLKDDCIFFKIEIDPVDASDF
eukprot:Seg4664.3 transcript_id=Seg4664.3/GoldUCD/mRNA.D3Y31 product="TNF receptor-associated factor 5" protein_id=Seg4664.3/GoldUCD/D3Y31